MKDLLFLNRHVYIGNLTVQFQLTIDQNRFLFISFWVSSNSRTAIRWISSVLEIALVDYSAL